MSHLCSLGLKLPSFVSFCSLCLSSQNNVNSRATALMLKVKDLN